jgi:hypothetical protein
MLLTTLLLLSTPAHADSFHFASCDLANSGGSWATTSASDASREAVNGVMVKIAQATSDSGGYCNILRGTGDESSADVTLNTASGSGISVSPSCEFRGQVRDSNSVHKALSYGDSATIDYGSQQKSGVYFASPDEASGADWVNAACRKVAGGISGVKVASKACNLPKDQGPGSMHGSWTNLPIALVLDRQFYLHGEAQALQRAVATWNRWGATTGKTLFIVRSGTGAEIPDVKDCSQASYTQALRGAVGVWRIDGTRGHENTRPSCGANQDGSPNKLLTQGTQGQTDWATALGKIQGASVLLNLADYNRPGAPRLDLESEMLHELGHVLGLLHSCNGSNASSIDSTTAPACFTGGVLSAPKAYTDAAMFPFLEDGQQKRTLTDNDMSRAACLY